MEKKSQFSVRDLALYGLLIAVLEVFKHALDFLPNVEMVSLLVILYTLHLGKRTLFLTLAFTLLEIFYWGPHTWVIMYLYVWPLLVFLTLFVQKHRDEKYDFLQFAVLSGLFGLFFGVQTCALPIWK